MTPARTPLPGPARTSAAIAAVQVALVAVELGWVPPLRFFWGLNLWSYLPMPARLGLAGAALALCVPALRSALATAAGRWARRLGRPGARADLALGTGAALLFWLLRERLYYGDSGLIVYFASRHEFFAPEFGASYLFRLAMRAAALGGAEPAAVLQVGLCLAGGAGVVAVARAAALLGRDATARGFVAAYVLSAGTLRIFAGHVEVYAWVLLAGASYLWAALAHLRGRCGGWAPCAVLGIGLWLHLACACLLPSLALLLAGSGRGRGRLAPRLLGGAALVAAPTLLFLGAMLLSGHGERVAWELRTLLEIAGVEAGVADPPRWVLGRGDDAGGFAYYALLSRAQLKYLGNAFFLLAPSALPILALFLGRRPRRLLATPETRLLAAACLPLGLYALLLVPRWGPYDWDLFALTGLCCAFLAARLVADALSAERLRDVGTWLVGSAHVFVSIPLLWIGIATSSPAGPFAWEPPAAAYLLPVGKFAPWM